MCKKTSQGQGKSHDGVRGNGDDILSGPKRQPALLHDSGIIYQGTKQEFAPVVGENEP